MPSPQATIHTPYVNKVGEHYKEYEQMLEPVVQYLAWELNVGMKRRSRAHTAGLQIVIKCREIEWRWPHRTHNAS